MPFVTITLTEDQYKLLFDILSDVEENETDNFYDDRTPEAGAYVMDIRALIDAVAPPTLAPAPSCVNTTIRMMNEILDVVESTAEALWSKTSTTYSVVHNALEHIDTILETYIDRDAEIEEEEDTDNE